MAVTVGQQITLVRHMTNGRDGVSDEMLSTKGLAIGNKLESEMVASEHEWELPPRGGARREYKATGLPVYLAANTQQGIDTVIAEEEPWTLTAGSYRKQAGAIAVASFDLVELAARNIYLYANVAFIYEDEEAPGLMARVRLIPVATDSGQYELRTADSVDRLLPSLRRRFDDSGALLRLSGEFEIHPVPPLEMYREFRVLRPSEDGQEWVTRTPELTADQELKPALH